MPRSPAPIVVTPVLDPKPWGGRRLAGWGVVVPPGEAIGEAHLAAPEATVAGGPLAGLSLAELARRDPDAWIGPRGLAVTGGQTIFPLLVKLIAAETDLSIQVHPDDRAAAAADLGTGKTEAYHVLAAAPGSVIYLGLVPETTMETFAAACRLAEGSAAALLRRVPAAPGMTILIPAGTIHAVGAGVTVYEIQQPSNVTFRLDDWGRVDAAGARRALHHDDGLAVVDPRSRPEPIAPISLSGDGRARELLVANRYFALERIALTPLPHHPEGTRPIAMGEGGSAPSLPAHRERGLGGEGRLGVRVEIAAVDSPQVLTVLNGVADLESAGWEASLTMGGTAIVPAGRAVAVTGGDDAVLLRGWVPDLEREVIAPARAAGATDEAIRRLGVTVSETDC